MFWLKSCPKGAEAYYETLDFKGYPSLFYNSAHTSQTPKKLNLGCPPNPGPYTLRKDRPVRVLTEISA